MFKSTILCAAGAAFLTCSASATTLLGYYEFEGSFNDSTANANHATAGEVPAEVNVVAGGFRGQGLDINDPAAAGGGNTGGSLHIPIDVTPTSLTPGGLDAVTFGGWVNVETYNGFTGFMANDNGGWDRGIQMQAGWGIASGGNLNNVGAVTPGAWQYVVGTFDGANATLYVGDAAAATQTTLSGSRPDAPTTPGLTVLEVGRYDNQDFDGLVDDVFVFADALNVHQANAIRNLRTSGLDYSPALANDLFNLFEAGGSGIVGGSTWSATTGLDSTNPGEVFDLGGGQWGLVLDANGNGLVVPEPTAPLLGALGLACFLFRRRRQG